MLGCICFWLLGFFTLQINKQQLTRNELNHHCHHHNRRRPRRFSFSFMALGFDESAVDNMANDGIC
jgi:hypothetical protein